MRTSACIFCSIVEGKAPALIVHEDEHIISFVPLEPAATGHTLIAPKAHHTDLYTIPQDVLAAVIASCQHHALRWRDQLGATGINLLHASGAAGEQSVFHFHFHALPRFPDDGLRAWPAFPGSKQSRDEMHAKFRLDR